MLFINSRPNGLAKTSGPVLQILHIINFGRHDLVSVRILPNFNSSELLVK